MSENFVIEVKNVVKSFARAEDSPRDIKEWLVKLTTGRLWRFKKAKLTVLDGISFRVRRGEILGIIGANGAGKSTLIRLLSGIYAPNSGEIIVREQLLPLVGLGAGFHPDLSGYENIFLNASMLGFSRAEIQKQTDSIIDFAELKDHIHQPVKRYSSGMIVRLAFAIACHINCPIILLDEVFSVGDGGFQRKSLEKVLELMREGRTIVLVSHNMQEIETYCTRCLVIDHGRVKFEGVPHEAAQVYDRLFVKKVSLEESQQPGL